MEHVLTPGTALRAFILALVATRKWSRVVDPFAGYGALASDLARAGYRVVASEKVSGEQYPGTYYLNTLYGKSFTLSPTGGWYFNDQDIIDAAAGGEGWTWNEWGFASALPWHLGQANALERVLDYGAGFVLVIQPETLTTPAFAQAAQRPALTVYQGPAGVRLGTRQPETLDVAVITDQGMGGTHPLALPQVAPARPLVIHQDYEGVTHEYPS